MDQLLPKKELVLLAGDRILVSVEEAEEEIVDSYQIPAESHQLVIIDDNPVIVKLYSRLFQKAGFIPFIARNGREGLDMILKTKPQAAVIDYHLPAMSGIEVCKEVREQMGHEDIKLILFTSDKSSKIRRDALAAGANAVVVKSPEASEIIHTVSDFLSH